MSIFSVLGQAIKGKVLVTTLIGAAFVGSAGVALAATPSGQDMFHTLTGGHPTVTATPQGDDSDKNTDGSKASSTANACEGDEDGQSNQTDDGDKNTDEGKATATAIPTTVPTATPCKENDEGSSKPCPGNPDAQQLATKFSLSTDSKSSSIQVICTLHDGTFQGTGHALGYGEIDQLLTYAQSLARKANATLSDSNVQMYVTTALKNCGSTAIALCVHTNLPANNSNGSDNSNGQNGGKPTVTPSPTSHGDGKPTGTPTPHANQ